MININELKSTYQLKKENTILNLKSKNLNYIDEFIDKINNCKKSKDIDKINCEYYAQLYQPYDTIKEDYHNLCYFSKKLLIIDDIENELNKKSLKNQNGYHKNDLLYIAYGYDENYIKFYQVLSTTLKTIKITEISKEILEKNYYNKVKPNKNNFKANEIIVLKSKEPKLQNYFLLHKIEDNQVLEETNSCYSLS